MTTQSDYPILEFQNEYRFLSNFYHSIVTLDDDEIPIPYPTVEHAYQAAKTHDRVTRIRIMGIDKPGQAKRTGRDVLIREDWEYVKLGIMEQLVRQKFTIIPLRIGLMATGRRHLQEGNYWGDTFWGVCRGVGENHLGKILMKVRDEIGKEGG